MMLDELQRQMESYRRAADDEGAALKDSYLVLERLYALYGRFDEHERALAAQVLEAWVQSDDENLRFDALALIDHFHVDAAIPAMQKMAERLATSSSPGAPYELKKIGRIIQKVGSPLS